MKRHSKPPEHGTAARYRGSAIAPPCRCPKCSARAVRDDALRTIDRLAGRPRLVPAEPVQQHLLQLRSRGLSYAQIARACGNDPTSVSEITRGLRTHVLRRIAEAILAVPLDWTETARIVDSTGSVRRVRALYAIGVERQHIAREIGVSDPFINLLVNGQSPGISAEHAAAIRALYDQLWDRPGPSMKNRYRAQREQWPGPLHWNDETIDDPDGLPDATGFCGTVRGWHVHRLEGLPMCARCQAAQDAWLAEHAHLPSRKRNPLMLAERSKAQSKTAALAENWEELRQQGYTMPLAAERLGVSLDSLHAAISRCRDFTPAA